MTAVSPGRFGQLGTAIAENRAILWLVFIAVHLLLGFLNLTAPGLPLGDVTIEYQGWAQQADFHTYYVGIDSEWVYPIVALVPMILVGVFGFANYGATWLVLIFVLDAIAFFVVVGRRHDDGDRSLAVGWWWIGFLAFLGPIALGRIDSVTIPLAVLAVLFLATRPQLAAVLLTLATWIKVWPAALIAAIVIASRARIRVVVAGAITSAVIVAIALALGAGAHVFSFIGQQNGRGLQVEAPISSVWMWMAFAHVPGAFVYYDTGILTYQVAGPGEAVAASIMAFVLPVAILLISALGLLALQRRAPVTELLPPLSLALISGFIAFDKVGSPQYITWLSVPIILGLTTYAMGHGRSFRTPAAMTLIIAVLTQTIYPYLYTTLLGLNPLMLAMLSLRNIMLFVLLAWSLVDLVGLTGRRAAHETIDAAWIPAVWPFAPHVDPWTVVWADAETKQDDAGHGDIEHGGVEHGGQAPE